MKWYQEIFAIIGLIVVIYWTIKIVQALWLRFKIGKWLHIMLIEKLWYYTYLSQWIEYKKAIKWVRKKWKEEDYYKVYYVLKLFLHAKRLKTNLYLNEYKMILEEAKLKHQEKYDEVLS